MTHTILIVDDEESIRSTLRAILEDEEYLVEEAPSGEKALELLGQGSFAAVMLDIWMEGIDGIETLRRIKVMDGELPVIMMSGHGTIDTAVSATKIGAYDFLEKPLSLERVLHILERAIREVALVRENRALKARMAVSQKMVGKTPVMRGLEQQIQRVAPTNGWVLITGENGTGKEVAARHIHELSNRTQGPFIPVNSAAIPEELIESELFGHEKGAFTGAVSSRPGRFEQANGGTLFLDEIGDMSLKTQAKILRILQEQRFERVGGSRQIQVDVRVIAASNKDLEKEIAENRFREDLFYRLNVVPLRMPPLRERREDIPELVDHFIRLQEGSMPQRHFSPTSLERLKGYHWPGNVRELRNLVERMLIMAPTAVIQPEDLPDFIVKREAVVAGGGQLEALCTGLNFREAKEAFDRIYLKTQLDLHGGNISRTAEAIDMERSALHRKLKVLGLG